MGGVLTLQLLTFSHWVYFALFSFFTSLVKEIFLERKHFKPSFCDLTGTKRGKHSRQREFQTDHCEEWLDPEHRPCAVRGLDSHAFHLASPLSAQYFYA